MSTAHFYPVGTPGVPWGDAERLAWRARQVRSRSYQDDVVARVNSLGDRLDILRYAEITYGDQTFPLVAARSRDWHPDLPVALVTGGVHGYETSGVMGALRFAQDHAAAYAGQLNVLVVPCVSPWAYERISRWNYHAIDPNRNFGARREAQESSALLALVEPHLGRVLVHIDLHETTDTDITEFRPALASRDGKALEPETVPDGFYLVGDSETTRLDFQIAIIEAVAQVTHIAPPDAQGHIIGFPLSAPGVIEFPVKTAGLCASLTGARFTTTTEVYPDSPRTNAEECEAAQVAAVRAALDFALAHQNR